MININYMGWCPILLSVGKPMRGRMKFSQNDNWNDCVSVWLIIFGFMYQFAWIKGGE